MSDVFVYQVDGEDLKLPSFKHLPGRLLRRYRKLEEMDFLYSILEELLDDEGLELLDSMDSSQQNDLFSKWQKAAKVSVPQS